jgi:hypothetical protein
MANGGGWKVGILFLITYENALGKRIHVVAILEITFALAFRLHSGVSVIVSVCSPRQPYQLFSVRAQVIAHFSQP